MCKHILVNTCYIFQGLTGRKISDSKRDLKGHWCWCQLTGHIISYQSRSKGPRWWSSSWKEHWAPSHQLRVWRIAVSSPSGSGAKPWPKLIYVRFLPRRSYLLRAIFLSKTRHCLGTLLVQFTCYGATSGISPQIQYVCWQCAPYKCLYYYSAKLLRRVLETLCRAFQRCSRVRL